MKSEKLGKHHHYMCAKFQGDSVSGLPGRGGGVLLHRVIFA